MINSDRITQNDSYEFAMDGLTQTELWKISNRLTQNGDWNYSELFE